MIDGLVKSQKRKLHSTEKQSVITYPPSVARLFATPTMIGDGQLKWRPNLHATLKPESFNGMIHKAIINRCIFPPGRKGDSHLVLNITDQLTKIK